MLDYLALQGSTENPTFVTIMVTILLAFLLSSLIAYTYEKTSRHVITPIEYLQSLILVSIVAATVMQAIGDSLARGLGMLGALAIIRFRTNLREPRNMIFTFASLAAGIACGVYGFVIGIVGTIGFCLAAFVLRFSPMSKAGNLVGVLKFDLPKSSIELGKLEEILSNLCLRSQQSRFEIKRAKVKVKADEGESEGESIHIEKVISYEYRVQLKEGTSIGLLDTALSDLESINSVRISFENFEERV